MNGKSVAILFLLVVAVILATLVTSGGPSFAQGGRFADYGLLPVQTASDRDALLIIDTTTERMVLWEFDLTSKQLVPADKADLRRDAGTPGRTN